MWNLSNITTKYLRKNSKTLIVQSSRHIYFSSYKKKILFCFTSYRVPCRFGTCKTPIEVTSSQLIASELFPTYVVKILLYPGAVANAIIKNRPLPSFSKLLKLYNITNLRQVSATSDLQRLEVGLNKKNLLAKCSYICLMAYPTFHFRT